MELAVNLAPGISAVVNLVRYGAEERLSKDDHLQPFPHQVHHWDPHSELTFSLPAQLTPSSCAKEYTRHLSFALASRLPESSGQGS